MAEKRDFILSESVLHRTPEGSILISLTSGESAYVTIGMKAEDGTDSIRIRGVDYRVSSHMHLEDGKFIPSENRHSTGVTLYREDHQDASRAANKSVAEFLVKIVNDYVQAYPERLRAAEALSINNDLYRVEADIAKAEAVLNELHVKRDALLVREEAVADVAPGMRP